eukprot:TRINITY_DN12256_c0_g1_i1.p1 TRINITY_DN12256_c0_g1~~TRINITY_DN12256_c0_g1_i1.p1  ORF type:complete len:320 (+),score=89.03 TRINITY_DN12256_c0_g1_i1:154-1113(+)
MHATAAYPTSNVAPLLDGLGRSRPQGLAMPSSPAAGAPMSPLTSPLTSVLGLRDRLLREAQEERQRCLKVAEAAEKRRAELHRGSVVQNLDVTTPSPKSAVPSSTGNVGGSASVGWTAADDAAQAEALQTLHMLQKEAAHASSTSRARAVRSNREEQLEAELAMERERYLRLANELENERKGKESAKQQVLCLEYELDTKENALQVAEKMLQRREADLQQAHSQLWSMLQQNMKGQGNCTEASASEAPRVTALRLELLERDTLLQQKEQHITQLMDMVRQHRSAAQDLDSTRCGSERSLPMSLSTAAGTYGGPLDLKRF